MSNEAQGLVRNLLMEAPHKPILMAYANYADEAGYCWPGVDTIAFDTGFSVPTVVRARRELIKGNWLRSKRQFGKSATTRLNLPKIAAEHHDRGDRTKIRPEFEFEDETAGHTRTDQSDLNVSSAGARTDRCDLNVRSQGSVYSDHTDHLSISDSSEDPSVEAQRDGMRDKPSRAQTSPVADWALRLVADLDYGRHRRPSRSQAEELARLVQAAHTTGLSEVEIRRHCRATLNGATKSGVAYLRGGLAPENLPVPAPVRANEVITPAVGPAAEQSDEDRAARIAAIRAEAGVPRGKRYAERTKPV